MQGVILIGDQTDHGGTVIEGFGTQTSMGLAWAGVGHSVVCPRCKGVYPIIEGHGQITVDGTPVAIRGMRTACGARLIAGSAITAAEYPLSGAAMGASTAYLNSAGGYNVLPKIDLHDDLYVLRDPDKNLPITFASYAIERSTGEFEFWETNAHGQTHLLSAVIKAEEIKVYLEGR